MFGRNICRTFFSRGSFSIFQAHFAYVLGNLSNSILSPQINQRTPLHFVVYEIGGDDDLLDMLLENGADANLVDGVCFLLP